MRRVIAIVAVCSLAGVAFQAGAADDLAPAITRYPYTAPPERVAKLRAGATELRRCMKQTRVRELLGAPNASQVLFGARGSDAPPEGSYWTYYLSKKQAGETDEPRVVVVFDNALRVRASMVLGLQGVPDVLAESNKTCP